MCNMATTGTADGKVLAERAEEVSMHGAKAAEELAKADSGAGAADADGKKLAKPKPAPAEQPYWLWPNPRRMGDSP